MRVSPVMGCKLGSMQTSLQTSDSQLPTVSWTSLCLMEGKPLFGAGERMFNGEVTPTGTVGEGV